MKTYLSGAITSDNPAVQEANVAQFYRVAHSLRAKGRDVINPCELDRGMDVRGWEWEDFIIRDLSVIVINRPVLYMMKGWELSRGARLEHALAQFLKLEIEYEE